MRSYFDGQVYGEEFTADGVATRFRLASQMIDGTERVYAGSLRMGDGPSSDYVMESRDVAFTFVPPAGTRILVDYRPMP